MGTGESVDDLFRRYGDSYRVLVTAAGMTASFVMVISSTIVNVAIPDVMGAFGIGQDQAQLMATAFNVAMVTSQLLNAWVVAVFGQRYGFCGTLLVFTIGSFIGGFAEDYGMIVFGRVLQGAAAGCIQPLIMVTIFQVFPADRRGFAMGVYGMGLTLAVGLGPVLGGVAIELLDWRYIFLAPIPLVFLALGLGFIFMPSVRKEGGQAFDWAGYALINIALFCCMTALTDGQREGWVSNYTTVYSLIALACGIGFVLWQARGGETLIDVSLFRNRNFALCAIIAFTFGMGNFGTAYAVPVFGQLVQGQTALDAGNMMLPAALIVVLALPIHGPFGRCDFAACRYHGGTGSILSRHLANGRRGRQHAVLTLGSVCRRCSWWDEFHDAVHHEYGAANVAARTAECGRRDDKFLPSTWRFFGVECLGRLS